MARLIGRAIFLSENSCNLPAGVGFSFRMKTLNKYIVTASVVLLGLTTFSMAQNANPGRRGGGTPEERVKAMKETLGINDEQATKIKAIIEKHQAPNQEKMKALREDTSIAQEDRRKKMTEIMKPMNDEINAVLTPDQQAKF